MSQQVSNNFDVASKLKSRLLSFFTRISWLKTFDNTIGFFTLNSSLLDGKDILKGNAADIFIFDQYDYANESDNTINLEYEREYARPISGISQAQGTINLTNIGNRYTPKHDPTIGEYVRLSSRPVRLGMGFKYPNAENINVFTGYSKPIEIDYAGRRATMKIVDAMEYIMNYTFDSSTMFINKRTDEIIASILGTIGFATNQYSLAVGKNTIPFAWIDVGDKAGDIIKRLAESELGHFYFDENGLAIFETYDQWDAYIYTDDLTDDDYFSVKNAGQEVVYNSIEVKSQVREVQTQQEVWALSAAQEILEGVTAEIWASFEDPCTATNTPDKDNYAFDSYLVANTASDGSGTDVSSYITVVYTGFAKSGKIELTNTYAGTVYITELVIYGTPAKVVESIDIKEEDATSIGNYETCPLTVENDFITSETWAQQIADTIIAKYKDGLNTIEMEVSGRPQRQLGDLVSVTSATLPSSRFIGNIVSIVGKFASGQFKQTLKILGQYKVYHGSQYFILNLSKLDSDKVLY